MRPRTRPWRLSAIPLALSLAMLAPATATAYPPEDAAYLDYDEMVSAIEAVAAEHPEIVQLFSIGRSHEGRELWAAKVSDRPAVDEPEPEVVFDGGVHAREHLSTEMAVALLRDLTDGYGRDPRSTHLVDTTEITIAFNVNPDGSEYDHGAGSYRGWRKNRQPTPGSTEVGTDINRNFGHKWGTSPLNADPAGETYRGPAPWSAPEAAAFKRYVDGRVVAGVQQIRVHVTFHQHGRVVLYPYGYSPTPDPGDVDPARDAVLVAIATEMASRSDYGVARTADFDTNAGNQMDWLYATHGVMSFTVEMGDAFYMPPDAIVTETARIMDAAYYAIEQSHCLAGTAPQVRSRSGNGRPAVDCARAAGDPPAFVTHRTARAPFAAE